MPLLARVMDEAGLEFAQIDRIAVTTGPGSFTGLRVGIAAARGIALAAGKPAVGLSTLSAFAAPQMAAAGDRAPVVAAIDARHDNIYLQVFDPGGPHARRAAHRQLAGRRAGRRHAGAAASSGRAPRSWRPHGRLRCRRRSWSMPARRRISAGWRGWARWRPRHRRRRSRSICAPRMPSRRPRRGCRDDDRVLPPAVRRRRAGAFAGRRRRRGAAGAAACGIFPARLERGGIRAPAARSRRSGASGVARPPPRGIHSVAARRRRGRDPVGRGRRGAAGPRHRRGGCSTCICGGSPASGRGRSFWRSMRTMLRRAGCMTAPDLPKSAAVRAIMRTERATRPR